MLVAQAMHPAPWFIYALRRWVVRNPFVKDNYGAISARFYTPFGVGWFGTTVFKDYDPLATGFYTPFGVGWFGTVRTETNGARTASLFLYALRRWVVRNPMPFDAMSDQPRWARAAQQVTS